eukprot:5920784-Pleurochrysis_carterae.AAC.6
MRRTPPRLRPMLRLRAPEGAEELDDARVAVETDEHVALGDDRLDQTEPHRARRVNYLDRVLLAAVQARAPARPSRQHIFVSNRTAAACMQAFTSVNGLPLQKSASDLSCGRICVARVHEWLQVRASA